MPTPNFVVEYLSLLVVILERRLVEEVMCGCNTSRALFIYLQDACRRNGFDVYQRTL
jgi:hypothetical protein